MPNDRDELNFVTLVCPSRGSRLRLRLGPAGAKLTGGVGGLTTEVLPRDVDAVLWTSHPPYGQVLDLMLDGLAEGRSVADDLHELYRIARAQPGEPRPPTLTLEGNARRKDLEWLVADLDANEDAAVGRESDGALVRIPVTLTLMEDVRPELAVKRAPAKNAKKKGRGKGGRGGTIVARKGDTLATLAQRHKVKGGARALARANDLKLGARLREGQRLRLP